MKTITIIFALAVSFVFGNCHLFARQGENPISPQQEYMFELEEMEFATDTIRIYGPTAVCDQATYTIENLPLGATVEWNASNNLTLLSGQGTAYCLFEKNGDGLSIIEATITTGEELLKIKPFEVWCGIPSIRPITGTHHLPQGGMGSFTAEVDHRGGVLYYWSVTPSAPISFSGKHAYIVFPSDNGDYEITLTVINCCGSAKAQHFVATGKYEPFE